MWGTTLTASSLPVNAVLLDLAQLYFAPWKYWNFIFLWTEKAQKPFQKEYILAIVESLQKEFQSVQKTLWWRHFPALVGGLLHHYKKTKDNIPFFPSYLLKIFCELVTKTETDNQFGQPAPPSSSTWAMPKRKGVWIWDNDLSEFQLLSCKNQ